MSPKIAGIQLNPKDRNKTHESVSSTSFTSRQHPLTQGTGCKKLTTNNNKNQVKRKTISTENSNVSRKLSQPERPFRYYNGLIHETSR